MYIVCITNQAPYKIYFNKSPQKYGISLLNFNISIHLKKKSLLYISLKCWKEFTVTLKKQ